MWKEDIELSKLSNQSIALTFPPLATKVWPDSLSRRCTCVSLKRRSETKLLRENLHAGGRRVALLFCRRWRKFVRCKLQQTLEVKNVTWLHIPYGCLPVVNFCFPARWIHKMSRSTSSQSRRAKLLDSYNPRISVAIWINPLFRGLFNFTFYWFPLMVSDVGL